MEGSKIMRERSTEEKKDILEWGGDEREGRGRHSGRRGRRKGRRCKERKEGEEGRREIAKEREGEMGERKRVREVKRERGGGDMWVVQCREGTREGRGNRGEEREYVFRAGR